MTTRKLAVDVRMIRHSGIGTYTRNVLSRLIRNRPDWHFTLLGDPKILGEFDWAASGNVSVLPFTKPIYGLAEQAWWLGRNLSADALWVPHYNVPLLWRGRLFVTIHDVAHLALPEFRGSLPKRLYAETLMRHIRRRAAGIAFVSEFSEREFTRLVGAPAGASSVIPHGVDPTWLETRRPEPAGRPYVVFLGNVKPNKNLVRLLEAFGRLDHQFPHELVLVGQRDGFLSGDDGVMKAASFLGDRVRFTGKLGDAEVRRLVAGADLLVMPSIYEGFGLPIVEAMACGCPVLAARAASLPEVGGDAVWYCDPFDTVDIAQQMGALLQDAPERQKMSDHGRARARRFDWNKVAMETAAVLEA
jgi:glycosyltransferase involved in cell wall biosynthesis